MEKVEKIGWTSTVVGSFPFENTPTNMETAFVDQINAGIEYPCYPQLVGMVEQFLDPLADLDTGISKAGLVYRLDGQFNPPKHPVATEYGQFVVDFLKTRPELRSKIKGWKACLTGPFTLAGDIIVSPELVNGRNPIIYQEARALMSQPLLEQIADYMAIVAKAYNDMGAAIISLDDPTLSLIVGKRRSLFHKDDAIIDILNRALAPITANSSIHICGRISPRLRDILLSCDVKIMDHEFVGSNNEGIFTRELLESSGKTLAVGVVESNVGFQKDGTLESYVETEAILEARIAKAIRDYGKNNIILKPDCGFGGLKAAFGQEMAGEMVRQKLGLLSKVMKKFD